MEPQNLFRITGSASYNDCGFDLVPSCRWKIAIPSTEEILSAKKLAPPGKKQNSTSLSFSDLAIYIN